VVYSSRENGFVDAVHKLFSLPFVVPVPCSTKKVAPVFLGDLVDILKIIASKPATGKEHSEVLWVNGKEEQLLKDLVSSYGNSIGRGKSLYISGDLTTSMLPWLEKSRDADSRAPNIADVLSLAALEEEIRGSILKTGTRFSEGISPGC
jgi:hypothetical protein